MSRFFGVSTAKGRASVEASVWVDENIDATALSKKVLQERRAA
jgi:hypothetical protein